MSDNYKKAVSEEAQAAFDALREPKSWKPYWLDEPSLDAQIAKSALPFQEARIDIAGFETWLNEVDYPAHHPAYYPENLRQKAVEHFAAAELLALLPGETYLDVASQNGVAAEIYARQFQVKTIVQDWNFPTGLHGNQLGGDAADLALPDSSINAAALHCSFEHFEGERDSKFLHEMERVLATGGRCVIAPFYIGDQHITLADPIELARETRKVEFDPGATIHALPGWGNAHGRFYSLSAIESRLMAHRGDLELTIYRFVNFLDVSPTCYLRFALKIQKNK